MNRIPEKTAYLLSGFISSKLGLNFPKERFGELEHGLYNARKDFGFDDFSKFIEWLPDSGLTSNEIEKLSTHFTIGETYFFRDIKYFHSVEKIIKDEILPVNTVKDKRLRIWSAGCSTGEEAYSIAIMLHRIISDIENWKITIMATDINPKSLKKANDGVYKDWSFRNSPDWLKINYFDENPKGHFKIKKQIKDMVTFVYHNLALDPFPSMLHNLFAFDIIFCRNVMMYFTQDLMNKSIEKFFHSLSDTGLLIVSPSEASHLLFGAYETLYFPDVILYKKNKTDYIPESYVFKPQEKFIQIENELSENDFLRIQKFPRIVNLIPKKINKEPKKIKKEDNSLTQSNQSLEIATSLFDKGDYIGSEKILKSFSETENKNSDVIILLAKIAGNRGLSEESIAYCKKAIEIDKLNPEPYYLLSTISQESGKYGEAVDWLKKAIYLDSRFVIAHFGLGNLFLKLGKITESKKYFKNAGNLLKNFNDDEIIPESSGITAGRLKEIISHLSESIY
ncbi:MAG: tetratricopeptide repeat protein [Bacteroidetes bacterium]|nr:MAG: tetratricopeptide repeat protein [Bacteroidota bacterium]